MYGVKKPSQIEKVETFTYRSWFQDVYHYILSRVKVLNVTTTYTIESNVFYVRADATGGTFTVSLPDATTYPGRRVFVKKIDASGNAITVSRSGTDTIEGSNTMSLTAQWNSQELISNGTNGWEKF